MRSIHDAAHSGVSVYQIACARRRAAATQLPDAANHCIVALQWNFQERMSFGGGGLISL